MRHVRNHHPSNERQDALQALEQDSSAWEAQLLEAVSSSASWMQPPLSNERAVSKVGGQAMNLTPGNASSSHSTLPSFRSSFEAGSPVEMRDADPFDGIQSWLEPHGLSLTVNVWDDLPRFEFGSITAGSSLGLSPLNLRQMHHSPTKDDIPDERYAKIASLWPMKKKTPRRLIQTLWHDVASYPEDNIFSQPAEAAVDESLVSRNLSRTGESRWGMDDARRARLIEDCTSKSTSPQRANANNVFQHNKKHAPEAGGQIDDLRFAKFPSTQILDISLDIYFRRFHHLMPFIHEPTFTAQQTSSSLLFPMCLMGMTLLDSVRAKRFVGSHLTEAVEQCRQDLVLSSRQGGQLGELLTALAAASLLLTVACITPKQALAEHSRLLYSEAMNVAQRHGLFVPQDGQQVSSTMWRDSDEPVTKWKAWARVESTKRLIVCLVLSDSFFSALDDHKPIIETELLHFYFPCKNELFQAPNQNRWVQLVDAGAKTVMPWMIPQLESASLPPPSEANTLGFFGLFSTIWIRIAEARHRHVLLAPDGSGFLVPVQVFAQDEHAASIAPLLVKIWSTYGETIGIINPNCEAFWHHLNISVTADLRIFELASGREGAESARKALDDIAIWSQTRAARRACVHAAQTFLIMSKRRPIDGTSYEAEIALVHAALVLGLYEFVMARNDAETQSLEQNGDEVEPFELLDKVDWNLVGNQGLSDDTTSGSDINMLPCLPVCPARTFICDGGAISFSGVRQRGGYASARRVLLDYVYLLDDIGIRYNVLADFTHILRILSDALIDLDSGGPE